MIYILLLLALTALLLQAAALRRLCVRPGEPAELRDEAWGWAVRRLIWLLAAGLVYAIDRPYRHVVVPLPARLSSTLHLHFDWPEKAACLSSFGKR